MQYAMGTVTPPSSDARMVAALMPIWSVMKLPTVLMHRMRCTVNNVSTFKFCLRQLYHLSRNGSNISYRCWVNTFWCLLFISPDLIWHYLFPEYYLCRFCHFLYLCWLQEMTFLLWCSLPLKYAFTLFSAPICKTSGLSFHHLSIFFSLNDLTCSLRVGKWGREPLFL